MCGILAYFNRSGITPEKLEQALASLKKIRHRGPDGEGVTLINTKTGEFCNLITDETPVADFQNSVTLNELSGKEFHLLLGHRRLSIIDLSTNGHQPMTYSNGNWIIFNGEIYNYIEIRNELKGLGYSFKTASDTEVIHAAYGQWKEKCLNKFNGMFSIVLYDAKQKKIFTANDRSGVKPLYFYSNAKEIVFFSEIKQASLFDFKRTLNDDSVRSFLNHGFLDHNDNSFYNEIKRHKPSHYSSFELNSFSGVFEQVRYYEPTLSKINKSEAIEQFKELFTDAVRLRLRSDVPLGFACSGGLDSSAVLYTAQKLLGQNNSKENITTFSAVFPGMEGNESEFIEIIEKDLKLNSFHVNPLEEFSIPDFERHIYHQDFPIQGNSFYAEWCVYKKVQQTGLKVLLVGQGADEILGGYHHHFHRYCRELILKGKILKYISLVKKYAEIKNTKADKLHSVILNEVKLAVKFKTGLADLGDDLQNKWNSVNSLAELLKVDFAQTTLPTYLRSDDRDSMAFSVETRHPFLDYRLVDFCFSLPADLKINPEGWQKWILRESMPELPETIRFRKDKKGFTVPQKEWVDRYLSDFRKYETNIPDSYRNLGQNNFFKYSLGAWLKLNEIDETSRIPAMQ